MELQAFESKLDEFAKAGAQVLGVSVDSFAAAGEFERKLELRFPLLSDFPEHAAASAYGAYDGERKLNKRITFVIDSGGVIRGRYEDPRNMTAHADEALAIVAALA